MAAGGIQPLTDYTTMSGAEFKRAVGADPEKWAAEFMKAATSHVALSNTERLAFATAWFRDAMEAAVKTVNVNDWVSVFGRGGTPSE